MSTLSPCTSRPDWGASMQSPASIQAEAPSVIVKMTMAIIRTTLSLLLLFIYLFFLYISLPPHVLPPSGALDKMDKQLSILIFFVFFKLHPALFSILESGSYQVFTDMMDSHEEMKKNNNNVGFCFIMRFTIKPSSLFLYVHTAFLNTCPKSCVNIFLEIIRLLFIMYCVCIFISYIFLILCAPEFINL